MQTSVLGEFSEPWFLEIAFLPFERGIPHTRLPDDDKVARERAKAEIISFADAFAFEHLPEYSPLWCFMQGVCQGGHMHRDHDPVIVSFGREYKFAGDLRVNDLPWQRGHHSELALWLPRQQDGPILAIRQSLPATHTDIQSEKEAGHVEPDLPRLKPQWIKRWRKFYKIPILPINAS